ncbi:MAG: dioxygenase [Pirellulaceae bacterium]|nr:dioxygenase [Pirellulaceae bacterium]
MDAALQPADLSICSRLEPLKRMQCRSERSGLCRWHGLAGGADGQGTPPCLMCEQEHTVVELERVRRVALMVTPQVAVNPIDEAWEAISTIRAILKQQPDPMTLTLQTVFLRRAEDAATCRRLFEAYYGERMPATNFVVQPPCGGQALAIEAWALGGEGTEVLFPQPDVVCVSYEGLRWVHVGGVAPPESVATSYGQARYSFDELARRLDQSGASFLDVVRTWLYVGGITHSEGETQRYRELNRARTDFFLDQESRGRMQVRRGEAAFYPASTGIGMAGRGLTVSCLALQTDRRDVRLLPLENPRQTSAFDYARRFSPQSPKFSRAMAVVLGDYVTTWISGTASIVDAESVHLGDVERQTEQTIDNIERLIGADNFARHGCPGAGAELSDLAKVRVYIKRPEDYDKCRAICERRFGALPTIYAHADVCRDELLVEIEGVAFSRRTGEVAGEPARFSPTAHPK